MSDIYLLDDHAVMREGLRALLQAQGHHVVGEAPTGAQALADMQLQAPAVLLLDLHLDGESGLQVLKEMQQRKLHTKTIVLTMSAQARDVRQAIRWGAMAYVLKGAGVKELMTAITTVLDGRRYFSAAIAGMATAALGAGVGAAVDDAGSPELSLREREIVALVVRGHSSSAIGAALNLSSKTVDSYRARLMTKLDVADVPALVLWAIRSGVVAADEP
jgi:two-component system, NarL family, invasion response regulator UvrY